MLRATVDVDAFEHHLTSPQGHGALPRGGIEVLVGGGSCCDQIRFGLALDGDRVTAAGFAAHGCGAATAAGSAAVTLVRGRGLLDAARVGPSEIAAELGGLSPGKRHAAELAADALHRALGRAARDQARLGRARGRWLAHAGGHERWRRQLGGGAAEPRATARRSRSPSSCGPTPRTTRSAAAARPRRSPRPASLAHSLGLPHLTLDLREEFRAGVVEPFIAGYAAGETPNPCVGCNGHVRLDAMLDLADRLGAGRLATGHYARVADAEHPDGPLLRAAVDAGQGPDLHARRARSRLAGPHGVSAR